MKKDNKPMSKFFLTMDADGYPLPVYDERKDIDKDYLQIYEAIQKASRASKEELLDWDDPKIDLR